MSIVVGTGTVAPQSVVPPVSSSGSAFDDLITSRVTGVAPDPLGATVDVPDSGRTGTVAVSIGEPLCLAASGCGTGSTGTLAVIDVGPVGALPIAGDPAQDSGAVPQSGSTPTAVVDFVGVQAVPEPATGAMVAAGVLALALSRRRRR